MYFHVYTLIHAIAGMGFDGSFLKHTTGLEPHPYSFFTSFEDIDEGYLLDRLCRLTYLKTSLGEWEQTQWVVKDSPDTILYVTYHIDEDFALCERNLDPKDMECLIPGIFPERLTVI